MNKHDRQTRDKKVLEMIEKHHCWFKTHGKSGTRADFSNMNLSNMNFINKSLDGAIFSNSICEGADFSFCILSSAEFKNADLKNTVFTGSFCCYSDFTNANFENSIIEYTSFNNSILKGSNFSHAQINTVDFRSANYQNANFIGADIKGTSFPLLSSNLEFMADRKLVENFADQFVRIKCDDKQVIDAQTELMRFLKNR